MNPILAFVVVMAVWTVSEYVAVKTKSLLSSLVVASIIFLVGFLSGIFPDDLLASSSLLALAGVVVGFIIVHLGTMISLDDFKKQWRTFLIGASTVLGARTPCPCRSTGGCWCPASPSKVTDSFRRTPRPG